MIRRIIEKSFPNKKSIRNFCHRHCAPLRRTQDKEEGAFDIYSRRYINRIERKIEEKEGQSRSECTMATEATWFCCKRVTSGSVARTRWPTDLPWPQWARRPSWNCPVWGLFIVTTIVRFVLRGYIRQKDDAVTWRTLITQQKWQDKQFNQPRETSRTFDLTGLQSNSLLLFLSLILRTFSHSHFYGQNSFSFFLFFIFSCVTVSPSVGISW